MPEPPPPFLWRLDKSRREGKLSHFEIIVSKQSKLWTVFFARKMPGNELTVTFCCSVQIHDDQGKAL
jgi:hypothetical protein